MAKWTGRIKRVKRWFRSDKLLVQMEKEEGDHNPPTCPPLYWEEVDGLRLDLIAFDLECRRIEVETLTAENARLRQKLVNVGSDTKLDVKIGDEVTSDGLIEQIYRLFRQVLKEENMDVRSIKDCVHRFKESPPLPADSKFPDAKER